MKFLEPTSPVNPSREVVRVAAATPRNEVIGTAKGPNTRNTPCTGEDRLRDQSFQIQAIEKSTQTELVSYLAILVQQRPPHQEWLQPKAPPPFRERFGSNTGSETGSGDFNLI